MSQISRIFQGCSAARDIFKNKREIKILFIFSKTVSDKEKWELPTSEGQSR